ncbi:MULTISPECIES: TlpA family protein disulfide reductase [Arthrobacter]|jgi:peroxiredoxin|uniref:Thiol-disulfide isomerase or thioredoxin n=1 Tax=Arthrobacter woluwensis TaxID=156980 RepID=A0A1H4LFY9_9MICC|nr:TlpA disulfide reductase family protein [Arthrobacter woluwensis]PSS44448.1 TlpA family protein disulfide reductase [Arthrobacter woluwensis]SEB69590.1 Thiol-disulfide isomerase or thioredoxin [Arthrobacter woluwensis]
MSTERFPLDRRQVFGLAGAGLLGLALSACSQDDPLAKQARAGDNKNYVAGDGSVTEFAPDQRKAAKDFQGVLFDGKRVTSKDLEGKVVVMNFWFAACAPCRVEAPDLKAMHTEFAPKGVEFYGVNLRDEKATAEAFEKNFGITYPSFNDKDGQVLLSVSGLVPPGAVPTTLIFDRKGRVSARILGQLEKGTLKTLIASALAERA